MAKPALGEMVARTLDCGVRGFSNGSGVRLPLFVAAVGATAPQDPGNAAASVPSADGTDDCRHKAVSSAIM